MIYPNGAIHWVTTNALVFGSENGEPARMLGATMDITPRKRAEAERGRLIERLRRSNEDLEDFAVGE